MTNLATGAIRRNSPAAPFRSVGTLALGDGANLDVQVGTSGGAKIINFRNSMRSRAGTLPAGPGALVGVDRVDDLIALLQKLRATL